MTLPGKGVARRDVTEALRGSYSPTSEDAEFAAQMAAAEEGMAFS